jgi:YD repeat-containing protein
MGRNTVVIRTIDGVSYTTNVGYDPAGRMNYIKYPDTDQTEYQYVYDSLGNLEQVNEVDGVNLIDILADFDDYNALGQIGYVSYANGTGTDYLYYDDNHRLQSLQTTNASGIIQKLDYTFDNVGNVDTLVSYTKPLATGSAYTVNYDFDYDNLDRLTNAAAACSNDASRGYNQTYQYDEVGNMTSKTGKGGWEVLSWDNSYQPQKPASVRFDFESEGIGRRNITYNHSNKPVQICKRLSNPSFQGEADMLTFHL